MWWRGSSKRVEKATHVSASSTSVFRSSRAQASSDHPIVCRTLREEGGVGNFCHAFIAEAHTIARAHIRARGGNACLKYRFTQFKLTHNSARNHAYVLCSILGDAALVVPATVSRSPRDSA